MMSDDINYTIDLSNLVESSSMEDVIGSLKVKSDDGEVIGTTSKIVDGVCEIKFNEKGKKIFNGLHCLESFSIGYKIVPE